MKLDIESRSPDASVDPYLNNQDHGELDHGSFQMEDKFQMPDMNMNPKFSMAPTIKSNTNPSLKYKYKLLSPDIKQKKKYTKERKPQIYNPMRYKMMHDYKMRPEMVKMEHEMMNMNPKYNMEPNMMKIDPEMMKMEHEMMKMNPKYKMKPGMMMDPNYKMEPGMMMDPNYKMKPGMMMDPNYKIAPVMKIPMEPKYKMEPELNVVRDYEPEQKFKLVAASPRNFFPEFDNFWPDVFSGISRKSRDSDNSLPDGHFQYLNVPAPKEYEFGWNRGNPDHLVSRYEQAKDHRFRTRVKWSDVYGGYGEQFYEYNHQPSYPVEHNYVPEVTYVEPPTYTVVKPYSSQKISTVLKPSSSDKISTVLSPSEKKVLDIDNDSNDNEEDEYLTFLR